MFTIQILIQKTTIVDYTQESNAMWWIIGIISSTEKHQLCVLNLRSLHMVTPALGHLLGRFNISLPEHLLGRCHCGGDTLRGSKASKHKALASTPLFDSLTLSIYSIQIILYVQFSLLKCLFSSLLVYV